MDIAFDTTWCPTCSRQILPKRIQVPVTPQPPAAAPAPPPSSPISLPELTLLAAETKSEQSQTRVARNKTVRARNGGLVHGTGRVKPNGTIKRPSPSNPTAARKQASAPVPPPSPTLPAQPTAPVRHRTVIDPSPTPLYCSDECRLADMQSISGLNINYNPERHGSPTVPTTAPSRAVNEEDSSDSSIGSSLESEVSSVSARSSSPTPSTQRKPRSGPIPIGYAALASIYDLPPCPPPPPFQPDPKPEPVKHNPSEEYTSGIIMAARRIQSVLGPQEKRKPSWSTPASKLSTAYANQAYALGYSGSQQHREVIPGWTDGSDKWRASVYSFARPSEDVDVSPQGDYDNRNDAYRGFVSTPCRSRGVFSTMGELKEGEESKPERMQRVASHPCTRARSEAEELYTRWDMSFTRRCESRTSASHQATLVSTSPASSTHSLPAYSSRKTRNILKKGAEGKLLVPNVQMKRTDSSMSLERMSLSRQGSETSVSRSKLARTESTSGSSVTEEDEIDDTLSTLDFRPKKACSPPMSSEPWYQNESTYPLLHIPRKEKKMIKKVIDGKEVIQEVVVEVFPERKRLFLFPGRDQN
ncbi:hypothetical protein BDY19DRAFT_986340 [Irpex rosettiformis]|uniref:Uncharacterized protein n=1 Tax=Irpex rosettiformis TaxID=378272 RepID=A0ACB8TY93_9APHY|nr:hypothetical protein BDY19DRAFT_986340 [Irpex rosettiformis]